MAGRAVSGIVFIKLQGKYVSLDKKKGGRKMKKNALCLSLAGSSELRKREVASQRAVAQIRMTPQAVILAESAVNIISWLPNRFLYQNTAETQE